MDKEIIVQFVTEFGSLDCGDRLQKQPLASLVDEYVHIARESRTELQGTVLQQCGQQH